MDQNQEWKEAKAPMYPAVRWTEQADPGKEESTVYLGNVVQGIYTDRKDGVGANDSSIYTLQLADGRKVGVWSSTVLAERMKLVPIGSEVRITLNGWKKAKVAGRKPWADFMVQYAKPVTEMQTVDPSAASADNAPAQAGQSNPATQGGFGVF